MIQSLDTSTLTKYVVQQLNNVLPDSTVDSNILLPFVKRAMERVEHCFSKIKNKYYFDGNVLFNHLNTDQYSAFLYYLSNTIWQVEKDNTLAGKVYCLNKALHCLDAFYEVDLPDIFRFIHPVGTVLGRGKYSDYFLAYQRVTVGGNMQLEYPVLGKGVIMYGGSAVIGKCNIGDGCLLAFGTVVKDQDIPSNTTVAGKDSGISCEKPRKNPIELYFNI